MLLDYAFEKKKKKSSEVTVSLRIAPSYLAGVENDLSRFTTMKISTLAWSQEVEPESPADVTCG